jgi:hypothetical protein
VGEVIVRALAILAFLVAMAGCTSSVPSPTASAPANNPAAIAQATPNPCIAGATQVAAFSKQLADRLSALHPLVQAAAFDSAGTLGSIRGATSSVTPYAGVAATLARCSDGAALASEVGTVQTAVSDAARPALSALITDAKTIRDGAVAVFNLLPQVLKLGQDAAALAQTYSTPVALAELPQGSADPLGTLPPLATPTPPPTPRPTPRPTSRPPVTTSGGSSGTSAQYRTAQQYLDSVQVTYNLIYGTVSDLWGVEINVPGLTQEEMDARKAESRLEYGPTVKQINVHLSFIENHPLRCLRDAYTVDKPLVSAWKTAFESYSYPGDLTSEGRAATQEWQDRLNATNAFLQKLSRYVADC